jgi:hypothetical protein
MRERERERLSEQELYGLDGNIIGDETNWISLSSDLAALDLDYII